MGNEITYKTGRLILSLFASGPYNFTLTCFASSFICLPAGILFSVSFLLKDLQILEMAVDTKAVEQMIEIKIMDRNNTGLFIWKNIRINRSKTMPNLL